MMEPLVDLIFHLDQHLAGVVHSYGLWTYLILFAIIFFETGLVIMPFLPGDSLLFVSGVLAAGGILNLHLLLAAFILGAVLGDTVNYWLGSYIGLHVFRERFPNLIKKEYLDDTYAFYEKYGGTTIFAARFVPVVRSFAPFLAGVGNMEYHRFLFYNVLGAVAWTLAVVMAGFYLGRVPIVHQNMSILIILAAATMAVTILLLVIGIISSCRQQKKED
ncbi:VTT domain-containing protein [Methanoregula sp.]|uniref:VTT domain-containing protein n=1 Tax=Methanoregula sp. TaxID=2052170 RepID=UPI002B6599FD|nr:VTT domain-containing protein [Methanoregula sp.]HVP95866.1 VTT domain-containing protein [Methanoregula sp.]